jgi:hypothetical protein
MLYHSPSLQLLVALFHVEAGGNTFGTVQEADTESMDSPCRFVSTAPDQGRPLALG